MQFRVSDLVATGLVAAIVTIPAAPAGASIDALGKPLPSKREVREHEVHRDKKHDLTLARKVIARAGTQMGTPWVSGGSAPGGFDCSGFTAWVFSAFGYSLPHSSEGQYALGDLSNYERIEAISELEVGDLVFFQTGYPVGHVGIYVGNDRFISTTSSMGVAIRSMYDSYWGPLYMGGVRIL